MIVFIDGAQQFGLKKGNLINAYQCYTKATETDQPDRKFNFVGGGKIVMADSLIAAMVKLNKIKDTLIEGDLISIKINVPRLES